MLRFSANIETSFLKTVVAVGPTLPVAANTNGDICNVFVYLLTVYLLTVYLLTVYTNVMYFSTSHTFHYYNSNVYIK